MAYRIGIVICRVGAILLLVRAIDAIAYNVLSFDAPVDLQWLFGTTLSVLMPLVAAFLLWVFAESICNISTDRFDRGGDLQVDSSQLIAAGMYLLGIYVLAFGIVDAFRIENHHYWMTRMVPERWTDTYEARHVAERIGYVGQLVVGVFLLVVGKRKVRQAE